MSAITPTPKRATAISAAVVPIVVLMIAGCATGPASPQSKAAAECLPVTLRLSGQLSPADAQVEAMDVLKDSLEAATDGKVTLELFNSGSLYDQKGEMQALFRGDLDMNLSAAAQLAERAPEIGIFSVPYLVGSHTVLDEIIEGEYGQQLFDIVEEKAGVRPLAALYAGTRELNLTADAGRIETPEDMKGVKLRVPDTEAWIRMGGALGAQPTPITFSELYLALDTGTVDGQDNPVVTTQNAKFYEVTDQIVLTDHLVDPIFPTISGKSWQKLCESQQDALASAAKEAADSATQMLLERESAAIELFESKGLDVYVPDVAAFRAAAEEEYLSDEALTSQWLPGMAEELQRLTAK